MLDDAAFADEAGEADDGRTSKTVEWYGGAMIIADSIAGGAILIGAAAGEHQVLLPTGIALGVTDGLLIHSMFGRMGVGFLSLLMRGGLVGGGALLACSATDCSGKEIPGAAIGAMAGGFVVGAAIDAAFVSYRPVPGLKAGMYVVPSSTGLQVGIAGAL